MPKRSATHMGERRKKILDAALECALSKGWGRTTIDDVASHAGLSKGGVYVHFANKRELLVGIVKSNVEAVETLASFTTYKDVRRMLLRGMDFLSSPKGQAVAISNLEFQLEAARDPELQQMLRTGAARMVEVFTLVVKRLRSDLSASEAATAALSLILLVEGVRSFRAFSDAASKAQLRAAMERQLEALQAK
jgi:TetR/AcrR family transcriptional regulator, repressor for uid operon